MYEDDDAATMLDPSAIVVLGVASTRVFTAGTAEGVNELLLCHLGSGQEMSLQVTNDQADAVYSFYLSTLGEQQDRAPSTHTEEVGAPSAWEALGEEGMHSTRGGGPRASLTEVQEL